jgi:hypothetical protein
MIRSAANSKPSRFDITKRPNASGYVIFGATADPIRLVQEELSVAERRFGVR